MTLVGVDWLAVAFWGAVASCAAAVVALLACIGAGLAKKQRRRVWRGRKL